MSAYEKGRATYRCANDCRFEGCPGHTLTVVHHSGPYLDEVLVDGKQEWLADVAELAALVAALRGDDT